MRTPDTHDNKFEAAGPLYCPQLPEVLLDPQPHAATRTWQQPYWEARFDGRIASANRAVKLQREEYTAPVDSGWYRREYSEQPVPCLLHTADRTARDTAGYATGPDA
jgi:hypothetical protein